NGLPKHEELRNSKELRGYAGHWLQWLPCNTCGKYRWVFLKDGIPLHNYCRECHPNRRWRYGKSNGKITEAGYKMVKLYPANPHFTMANENGYVMEHRLIMAQHLCRCLDPNEIVHHINGNRLDNTITNLRLFASDGKHQMYHHSVRRLDIQSMGEKAT
ncbi:MAG: HNH endonuclease, partial [Dehalococcoidia bacterium]|nr:HNH endonuclease [Dehalococcoidia bacterium]